MDVGRYLERIGYCGPLQADYETLAGLQRAHLLAVPFDALDCHLGNTVTVLPEDAYRKVVEHRRGGFCFELNGLFLELLTHIGFEVTPLAARPFVGGGGLAPVYAHLTLLVQLEKRWLADVGFGFDFAIQPLDLDRRDEQQCDEQAFRIQPGGNGLDVVEVGSPLADVVGTPSVGTTTRNGYRLELAPKEREDFAERCRVYSTDPETGFVRDGPVMQRFGDGLVRVTRSKVCSSRPGGIERPIEAEDDWHAQLESQFGLVVSGRNVRGPGAPV